LQHYKTRGFVTAVILVRSYWVAHQRWYIWPSRTEIESAKRFLRRHRRESQPWPFCPTGISSSAVFVRCDCVRDPKTLTVWMLLHVFIHVTPNLATYVQLLRK